MSGERRGRKSNRDLQTPLLRKEASHSKRDDPASGAEKSELTSLMRLLTKPSPLNGASPWHPDFLEFRCRNLQWRKGFADGTRGEVTDIESKESKEDLWSAVSTPASDMHRCASWPLLDKPHSSRKLWMLSPDLESDLKRGFPQVWHRLQSYGGLFLQMLVLVLVVCTYAACPLTVSWAKVVGQDGVGAHSVPIKGRPFKESSVIVVSWALIAAVGLLLSATLGGRRAVRQCLDQKAILRFAPAGVGWALADVCEVLAVARIDPATYGVISQARLLGAAAACWLLRGMRQTRLQWGVLFSLSLVCMAYCLVPDDPVPNKDRLLHWRLAQAEVHINWYHLPQPWLRSEPQEDGGSGYWAGLALALGKVALSVLSGVYGETCFKQCAGSAPAELHVQMTQISVSSAAAALLGHICLCPLQNESPSLGEFFTGPDGHWSYRTFIVAAVYCWREWICNLCVKRFDSLVKNICNAVALVVTYMFTVAVTGEKPFCLLKVILLLAAVAEVVNYVATRRTPAPSPKAAAADTTPAPGERRQSHRSSQQQEAVFEAKEY
mmetsp:Transcript_101876/g.297082  ORF Transcript_101876/g.297082 Transcript_101876/m.297082 type:complete len:551 (-) Transcript_101876:136-1788(-)